MPSINGATPSAASSSNNNKSDPNLSNTALRRAKSITNPAGSHRQSQQGKPLRSKSMPPRSPSPTPKTAENSIMLALGDICTLKPSLKTVTFKQKFTHATNRLKEIPREYGQLKESLKSRLSRSDKGWKGLIAEVKDNKGLKDLADVKNKKGLKDLGPAVLQATRELLLQECKIKAIAVESLLSENKSLATVDLREMSASIIQPRFPHTLGLYTVSITIGDITFEKKIKVTELKTKETLLGVQYDVFGNDNKPEHSCVEKHTGSVSETSDRDTTSGMLGVDMARVDTVIAYTYHFMQVEGYNDPENQLYATHFSANGPMNSRQPDICTSNKLLLSRDDIKAKNEKTPKQEISNPLADKPRRKVSRSSRDSSNQSGKDLVSQTYLGKSYELKKLQNKKENLQENHHPKVELRNDLQFLVSHHNHINGNSYQNQ